MCVLVRNRATFNRQSSTRIHSYLYDTCTVISCLHSDSGNYRGIGFSMREIGYGFLGHTFSDHKHIILYTMSLG